MEIWKMERRIYIILGLSILLILSTDILVFYSLLDISVTKSIALNGLKENVAMHRDAPVPVIDGIDTDIINVYNHCTLHLDASRSYSRNGNIIKFAWQVNDDGFFHGKTLDLKIDEKIDSNSVDELPVIYVMLTVVDERGIAGAKEILIRVLPDRFYLSKDGLSIKRENDVERISLRPLSGTTLTYMLPESMDFPPCGIKLNMDIRKGIISKIFRVELYGLTEDGDAVKIGEKKYFLTDRGDIEVYGEIEKNSRLKGFQIRIRGFSLKKIEIDYSKSYIDFSPHP